MRRIGVLLSKGGVGKTTTAVNLAHALALDGARVLLVDCDSQGQCAAALGLTPAHGLADLVDGMPLPEACTPTERDGLTLLAGGRALAGLQRDISRRDFGSERVLAEALAGVDGYDYLVLDTSPAWDALTVNALFSAEEVLAPVALEPLAMRALGAFLAQLGDVRRYHAGVRLRWICPTFADGRVAKSAELLGQLGEAYGALLTEPIRYSVRLSECAAFGRTIFEHDPGGRGAADYAQLARRVTTDAT